MNSSPTKTSYKEEFISYTRGFSMLTIVGHHYLKKVAMNKLLYTACFFGGSGIHAFIFVSGYGLGLSKTTDWPTFYQKRFRKVLLPYYIGVTLIFVINLLLPIYQDDWHAYLGHVLLYKMFVESYNVSFGGHFWFISTILQLYILFPLISYFVTRSTPVKAILTAVTISVAYGFLLLTMGEQDKRIWTCSALQYGWEFVLGMVIARKGWLPVVLRQSWLLHGLLFIVGVAGTVLLVQYAGATGRQFNDYFAFVGYMGGCTVVYKLSQSQALLVGLKRFVLWVEPFSYALFITHILVLDGFNVLAKRPYLTLGDFMLLGPVLWLTAICFHRLTNQLIEKRKPQPIDQPVAS